MSIVDSREYVGGTEYFNLTMSTLALDDKSKVNVCLNKLWTIWHLYKLMFSPAMRIMRERHNLLPMSVTVGYGFVSFYSNSRAY